MKRVFEDEQVIESLPPKVEAMREAWRRLRIRTGEIRQVGLVVGVDLVDARGDGALDWRNETGAKVCRAARRYGLLTRPVRDTLTLMPPLCVSVEQIHSSVEALDRATRDVLG